MVLAFSCNVGKAGYSLVSLLLHLAPVGAICYFGAVRPLDPADLEVGGRPSAPLEIRLAHREAEPEVRQPLPEPAALPVPEAVPEAVPEVPFKVQKDAPVLPENPPTPTSGENIPSVESETLPQQVYNPPPEYPLAARRQRLEGSVVVEVEVLEDGSTAGARIVKDCDVPLFSASALEAVRKWKFQPALRGGKPVRSLERVRFVFKLTGR